MNECPRQGLLSARLSEVYRTATGAMQNTSCREKAILALTLAGVAFEWSTGNETLLCLTAAETFDHTNNVVAAAAAAGGVSFAEQGILGVMMSSSISKFPRVSERVDDPGSVENCSSLRRRFFRAFAFGAAVSLVVENSRRPRAYSENIKLALSDSAMIGAGVFVAGAGATGLLYEGAKYGFADQADAVVGYALNPLVYLGIFATSMVYNKVKQHVGCRIGNRE